MKCGEAEALAAEFAALALQIGSLTYAEQEAAVSAWLDGVDDGCLRLASKLVVISRARNSLNFPTGSLTQYFVSGNGQVNQDNRKQVDQSTHVTAGGDATGIAGTAARIEHSTIQSFKDGVTQSGNIDKNAVALFHQLLDEVGEVADADVQQEILDEVKKLQAELAKATPKESLVRKSFNALKTFVGALPTLTKVGAWINEKFGWTFF